MLHRQSTRAGTSHAQSPLQNIHRPRWETADRSQPQANSTTPADWRPRSHTQATRNIEYGSSGLGLSRCNTRAGGGLFSVRRADAGTADQHDYVQANPVSQNLLSEAVAQAQAAAEAEQEVLMSTGPLADDIYRGNKQLVAIMGSYSTPQRLYHKAVLPIYQRHGQLAISNVDLACSIHCELLKAQQDKEPGDTISSAELQQLSMLFTPVAAGADDQLQQFAGSLCELKQPRPAVEMFVMPSISRLLMNGFSNSDAASSLQQTLAGNDTKLQPAVKVLLALCQSASLPPDRAVASTDVLSCLVKSLRSIQQMSGTLEGALALLPTTDHPKLLQAITQLSHSLATAHSNACTTVCRKQAIGSVLEELLTACLFTCCAATMHNTAVEHLAGTRSLEDWGPINKALAALATQNLLTDAPGAWLATQQQFTTLAKTRKPSLQLKTETESTLQSMAAVSRRGGLLAIFGLVALAYSQQEGPHHALQRQQIELEAETAIGRHINMLQTGMLEAIDSQYGCWSSLWYWMSLVTLSLQQTGGKQGPEAVAVAEQLMKEKHSVFMARLWLQTAYGHLQPGLCAAALGLLSACQMPCDSFLELLIIARGDQHKVLDLSFHRKKPPSSWPKSVHTIYKQAASDQEPTVDEFDAALELSGRQPFSKELMTLLGMRPVHRPVSAACEAWTIYASNIAMAAPAARMSDHIWFAAGVAIDHIYTHSSSNKLAHLMLGQEATEKQYVRPLGSFVQQQFAKSGSLMVDICTENWSIDSRSAGPVLLALIRFQADAQHSRYLAEGIMWLLAAALGGSLIAELEELVLHEGSFANQPLTFNKSSNMLKLLVFGSAPCEQLEPPAQALMQVAVKRWLRKAPQTLHVSSMQLDIISRVPLLHADDYEVLLRRAVRSGDQSALSQIWSAAISASTDPQLSVTPAFGGQRPDKEWLLEQLDDLLFEEELHCDKHATLLLPLLHNDTGSATAARSCGVPLLYHLCQLLLKDYSAVSVPPSQWSSELLKTIMSVLSSEQQLDRPPNLVAALSAAAGRGAAAGDLKVYHLVVQQSAALQLTHAGVTAIRSAAIQAAASAMISSTLDCGTLLELWSDIISALRETSAAVTDAASWTALTPSAADTIVSLMRSHSWLADKLLRPQLPLLLLSDLLEAASALMAEDSTALQQLLRYTKQDKLLLQLPSMPLLVHRLLIGLEHAGTWEQQAALVVQASETAQQLLQGPAMAVTAAAATSRPEGWRLLKSLCNVVSKGQAPPMQLDAVLHVVVELLCSNERLGKPPGLLAAVSAAAARGAAIGDIEQYQAAVKQAHALKLTAADIRVIRSAAVKGAADAMTLQADQNPAAVHALLELWSDVIIASAEAKATSVANKKFKPAYALEPSAASAIVEVFSKCESLGNDLLQQQQQLPRLLLGQLVDAAVSAGDATTLQLLLHHARKHNMLQELLSKVSDRYLCNVVEVSSRGSGLVAADNSWDLYLLLHESWQTGAETADRKAVKAAAVPVYIPNGLLQQQGNVGYTDMVLQLWTDNAHVSVAQLSSDAQAAVLSALVQSDQQHKAVELVRHAPQQLPQLVTLWQQQQQQQQKQQEMRLGAEILLDALRYAVAQADAGAAAAVEGILQIIQHDGQQAKKELLSDSTTALQLAQMLSTHGRLQAAKSVLADYIIGRVQLAAAVPVLMHFVKAAAAQPSKQQRGEVVIQLLQEEQQHLHLAVLDALLLEKDPAPAAVALMLEMMQHCYNSQQLLLLLDAQQLEQLCLFVSKHSSSRVRATNSAVIPPLTTLPSAADLASHCISCNTQLSTTAVVARINSMAAAAPDLQPASSAYLLELLPSARSAAAAAARNRAPEDDKAKLAVLQQTSVIAQLCYQVLIDSIGSSSAGGEASDSVSVELLPSLSWVSQLTHEAAAAALFATWYWAQSTTTAAAAAAGIRLVVSPPPAATVIGMLCLELYHAARSGQRPTVDGLLLDLGLVAAAAAQQWRQGAAVISTAERALASAHSNSGGSSRKAASSKSSSAAVWVPLLPAALTALPAIMVHTQGVTRTAELLIREHELQQLQQPDQAPARKGKAVTAAAAVSSSVGANMNNSLLSPACISSFMSASVDVATAVVASGDGDAAKLAAAEAAKVAHALYGTQLVTAQLVATSGSTFNSRDGCLNANLYSSLLQLYGLTGQLQQVADITMAAVHGQLQLQEGNVVKNNNSCDTSSVMSAGGALQQVLAGSAAALLSAGAAAVVFDLLDGLTSAGFHQVTHKQLVERLIQAAEAVDEDQVQQALSCRLSGGSEAAETFMLCSNPEEVLQELGGGCGGDGDLDGDSSSSDKHWQVYLQLVSRDGLEPLVLKQQLQQRLRQAVQHLV